MSGVQLSTSAFSAFLVVGTGRYVLTSLDVQYFSNGISAAQVELAVGFRGDSLGGTGAPGTLKPLRGTPAQVVVEVGAASTDPVGGALMLSAGEHVIFNGLVDDSGPGNLAQGMFNISVRLMSRLGVLATGTLQLGKLIPRTYLDTTVPINRTGDGAQQISPGGYGFTSVGLQSNAWQEFQRIFTDISVTGANANGAATTALAEYIDFLTTAGIGDGPNTAAIAVIKAIKGTLVPGNLSGDSTLRALVSYLNNLFTTDYRMESFLNRIVNLGQEFKFRVFENMAGLQVVPYSPFFDRGIARDIDPSTIVNASWMNREPNSVLGCVTTLSGINMANNHDTSRQPLLIGKYARPSAGAAQVSPLGNIVSFPAPNWLAGRNLVDGSTANFAAPLDVTTKVADAWTKEMALEMGYRGYTMQLQCPFRLDHGVLDPVRVIYPSLAGAPLGPSVFGSIQMVRLMANAQAKQAGTFYEVGYVRSDALQASEIDGYVHPIWTTQYAGGRLDTGL